MHKISDEAAISAYVQKNILISPNSRACIDHFETFDKNSRLTPEALNQLTVFSKQSRLSANQISLLINSLRQEVHQSTLSHQFSDFNRINPKTCVDMLGIIF